MSTQVKSIHATAVEPEFLALNIFRKGDGE